MLSSSTNHAAHDYAERIRERLQRRLQELRAEEGCTCLGIKMLYCGERECHAFASLALLIGEGMVVK